MRVVAYSIRSFEKELLAKANQKKHDITLISNRLSLETVNYAAGKDAVLVFTNDDVSAAVIEKLAAAGIKYIATRSVGTDHIDREAADRNGIKLANVPGYSPQSVAEYTLTLALALSRKLIPAVDNSRAYDFRIDNQLGFNFSGKTIGLVGLGQIGLATARIFRAIGCEVIGNDLVKPQNAEGLKLVGLEQLLETADVVSLHAPLTPNTRHLIQKETLQKMKPGAMLINTSRGGLVNSEDVLEALLQGDLGYFGADVYEFEKEIFYADHRQDKEKDPVLTKLMSLPNVIVTPHVAFLTTEAVQQIALQTIANLDKWQEHKCLGKHCVCVNQCQNKSELANQPAI